MIDRQGAIAILQEHINTYRWKAIAKSETERPLLDMIKDMDVTTHRIVSNQPN